MPVTLSQEVSDIKEKPAPHKTKTVSLSEIHGLHHVKSLMHNVGDALCPRLVEFSPIDAEPAEGIELGKRMGIHIWRHHRCKPRKPFVKVIPLPVHRGVNRLQKFKRNVIEMLFTEKEVRPCRGQEACGCHHSPFHASF